MVQIYGIIFAECKFTFLVLRIVNELKAVI